MLPKTNMLFVLLLALLALEAPKEGIDVLGVPKPVVLTGGEPNGDLLSPNALLLLAVPNARFGVPKVFVAGVVPNVPADGVVFAPNIGTDDALLSVEPNMPVVALKAGVVCALVTVPALGDPNTVVASFAASKPGAMVLVDVLPNVDAVVVCVFEPNNVVVVPPNMVTAAPVPKDVDGFVCPKIGEPLPNTEGDAVVEVKVTLALENRPGLTVLFDVDMTLVVGAKIEDVVVFELNTPVVPGTDVAPKSG